MKFGVHSIDGKMGRAIVEMIAHYPDLSLGSGFVRDGHVWKGQKITDLLGVDVGNIRATSHLETFCLAADVIIDFTRPEATLALLPICCKHKKPLMIGTTGFTAKTKSWIEEASKEIPVILAANTSVGINVLLEVTRQVASILPKETWQADVLDLHHCHKVDAPSGTALKLGQVIAQAQGGDHDERMIYPYHGQRSQQDIGYAVIRAGEIIGEHTVYFTSANERLELTHRAASREIFAQGALLAAQWLLGKPAGFYTMADVLGFHE